jgi:hypothetical protein
MGKESGVSEEERPVGEPLIKPGGGSTVVEGDSSKGAVSV